VNIRETEADYENVQRYKGEGRANYIKVDRIRERACLIVLAENPATDYQSYNVVL
jgi:hypothetical protein